MANDMPSDPKLSTTESRAKSQPRKGAAFKRSKDTKKQNPESTAAGSLLETEAKKRLKDLPFAKLLPSFATVAGLCTGLSAIRFAMLDRYEVAVFAIIIAAILDGIDGRIARLLKASSDFGAELDSLSDFICFGVGPAVVVYMLTLKDLGGFGWGITLFYAVCMALRLARFNAMHIKEQREAFQHTDDTIKESPIVVAGKNKFFVGTPAPAAAFIGLLPLMIHFALEIDWIINPLVHSIFMLGSGFLMISRLPTYSFKSAKIPRSWALGALIIATVLIALVVSAPWHLACGVVITYLATIPFSFRDFMRLKQREVS